MEHDRSTQWCACSPVSEATYDSDGGRSATQAVVEALAAANVVTPTELHPLNDFIDCAALDRLFDGPGRRADSPTTIRFSVDGWNVFVRDDGRVRVCDPDVDVEPAPVFERPVDG